MLVKVSVKDVSKGNAFNYAGQSYVRATEQEESTHIVYAADSIIPVGSIPAYRPAKKNQKIPCSFLPETKVFIKVGKP